MAEKTKLKKVMEKIRNFEEEERFEIKKALYSGCKFTQEQKTIMDLVFKNQLHEHYGLLTLLYNCYSQLESELPREERLSERFFALRWDSYMKAYSTETTRTGDRETP